MAMFKQPFNSLYSTPDDQRWLKEVTSQERASLLLHTGVCRAPGQPQARTQLFVYMGLR